jgi:single-strand DNA-binding protein
LAENMFHSLGKGDRVVVAGRLRIREWEDGEKSGTTVEIDAATVGHDLSWGTSAYTRRHTPAVETETGAELEPQADLPF